MKAVLQRVTKACVAVEKETVGEIGKGILLLLGVAEGDTEEDAAVLARKIAALRIFSDGDGKMNLSVRDVAGGVLAVSNFTLMANYRKGNRPDYLESAPPAEANRLYEYFCAKLLENGISKVETGVFAADMKVEIENDGPVTIVMDTDIWDKR